MNKTVAPFVRNPYNYDMNRAGDESGLECKDASKTKQSMADECDINKLVARYVITGEMPQLQRPPLMGDFDEVFDFQTAMNTIVQAQRSFMQMPADVRSRFGNDPGEFVKFCSNEDNRDEMRRMGLWSKEANEAFELKAQTQKDLDLANARDAELHRAAQKGGKGDTTKGVT